MLLVKTTVPEIDHQQLFYFICKKSSPIFLLNVYDIFWYLANTNVDARYSKDHI